MASTRPRTLHVFINPAAGQDKPVLAILARTFGAAGLDWRATVLQPGDDLPELLTGAARALFLGETEVRRFDLVDAAGTPCILRAGLGGDARLMQSADREAKDSLGWAAYLRAAIAEVAAA